MLRRIFAVAFVAIALNHLRPLVQLAGIGVSVPSIGLEHCKKVAEDQLINCEDVVLAGDSLYVACDPVRSKFNKIMGINFLELSETVPEGSIWRVHHTEESPRAEELKISISDFHPLGVALDEANFLFVINLPHKGEPAVEVFSFGKDTGELVHVKKIQHPLLYTPNSMHVLQSDKFRSSEGIPSFFFSNDHFVTSGGLFKHIENFSLLPLSNVMFYDSRTQDVYPVLKGLVFANGLAGDDFVLFVAETNKQRVSQYRIDSSQHPLKLEFVKKHHFDMATDNLHYDVTTDQVVVAGHPKGLDFMKYVQTRDKTNLTKPSSLVAMWEPSKDVTRVLFSDNGTVFATSSTGIVDGAHSKLIISALYDQGIMICNHNAK